MNVELADDEVSLLLDGRRREGETERERIVRVANQIVANRAEQAVADFAQWVATHRAYNGSDHDRGQSLYNESINGVLPQWAADYLKDHLK